MRGALLWLCGNIKAIELSNVLFWRTFEQRTTENREQQTSAKEQTKTTLSLLEQQRLAERSLTWRRTGSRSYSLLFELREQMTTEREKREQRGAQPLGAAQPDKGGAAPRPAAAAALRPPGTSTRHQTPDTETP
jgi:hypothetical protein